MQRQDNDMSMLQESWVRSANSPDTDFPLNNLPYGVFSQQGGTRRCGVAIGDRILDLTALEEAGRLTVEGGPAFREPQWNSFMRRGPKAWGRLRQDLTRMLSAGHGEPEGLARFLVPMAEVQMHLPFEVK